MSDVAEPEVPSPEQGGPVDDSQQVSPDLLRAWPLPQPNGTKYARGLVLVVGGSATTPGAAMLAGISALRAANRRDIRTEVAPMRPETALRLAEIYRSEVERLAALTRQFVGAIDRLEGDEAGLVLHPHMPDQGTDRHAVPVVVVA